MRVEKYVENRRLGTVTRFNVVRDPFDLVAHSSRYHVTDHLKIADERPKREAKAGGFVLFDDKMGDPGEPVTDYEKHGEEIPLAACDKKDS